MRLKNGWPWSSLQNTGCRANPALMTEALKLFHNTEWEHRRHLIECTALYPSIRYIRLPFDERHDSFMESNDVSIKEISLLAFNDIKESFPTCKLHYSELIYFSEDGYIPWHIDRRKKHYLGTKIMLLLENEEVDYYFTNWNKTVPLDTIFLDETEHISDNPNDYIKLRMNVGDYYVYNHRIPHMTKNLSGKIRATLMLELVPTDADLTNGSDYCFVYPEELDSLAPPIL